MAGQRQPQTRLEQMIHLPMSQGFYNQAKTEIAVREHTLKTVKFMQNTLKDLKSAVGRNSVIWKTLYLKYQLFREYASHEMRRESRKIPKKLTPAEKRKFLADIYSKLDTLGSTPFFKCIIKFSETCVEILIKELNNLERILETSRRRLDDRVNRLRIKAHDCIQELWSFHQVRLRMTRGGTLPLDEFWMLVLSAHHAILALDKSTRMSNKSNINALENFVGLTLTVPVQAELPQQQAVVISEVLEVQQATPGHGKRLSLSRSPIGLTGRTSGGHVKIPGLWTTTLSPVEGAFRKPDYKRVGLSPSGSSNASREDASASAELVLKTPYQRLKPAQSAHSTPKVEKGFKRASQVPRKSYNVQPSTSSVSSYDLGSD